MRDWLDPVRLALDAAASPTSWFVRDDDAGWSDDALYRLLDVMHMHEAPLDVAASPAAVGAALGRRLSEAMNEDTVLVSVHQHGLAHVNHEAAGRKAEFGPARPQSRQRDDISAGRRRLEQAIGLALPPFFTPPWNRCTGATAAALVELGFELLSCDASAPTQGIAGLEELPVHLDWNGRRGTRHGAASWGETVAGRIRTAGAPIGLLLHHAAMAADDWKLLPELLALLTTHGNVRVGSMAECAGRLSSTGPRS
jgi:hypothetical protein